MSKVLHVGPDACSVVFRLLKEDETEAWGAWNHMTQRMLIEAAKLS